MVHLDKLTQSSIERQTNKKGSTIMAYFIFVGVFFTIVGLATAITERLV
jgi:hypothetical protein